MVERVDIVVTERGARVVRRNIDDIGRSAQGTGKATTLLNNQLRRIGRASLSLRQATRNFNRARDAAKNARSETSAFTRTLRLVGGALVLRSLVQASDAVQNLRNRLQLTKKPGEDVEETIRGIGQVAIDTRGDFDATAQSFTRISLALKETDATASQVLAVQKTLNQAVQLSGASATEAANATIQLTQGLASGALRGDELRSVLEQLPAVADIIAKELNVTRGELRKLGEQGKISTDIVVKALQNQAEATDKEFKKTTSTIGQALSVLNTQFVLFVSDVNNATGAASLFSDAILFISDNLNVIIPLLVAFLALLASAAIINAVAAFGQLAALLPVLTAGFALLNGVLGTTAAFLLALVTNPITLLLGSIALLIVGLNAWREELATIPVIGEVVVKIIDAIVAAVNFAINALKEFGRAIGIIGDETASASKKVKQSTDGAITGFRSTGKAAGKSAKDTEKAFKPLAKAISNPITSGVSSAKSSFGELAASSESSADRIEAASARAGAASARAASSRSSSSAAAASTSSGGGRTSTAGGGGSFGPSGGIQELARLLGGNIETSAGRSSTGGFIIQRRIVPTGQSREEIIAKAAEVEALVRAGGVKGIASGQLGEALSIIQNFRSSINLLRAGSGGGFLGGFQQGTGGPRKIPGLGGGDRNMISLAAAAGETLEVKTRRQQEAERANQSRGDINVNVDLNVNGVTDANSFRRNKQQITGQLIEQITRVARRV